MRMFLRVVSSVALMISGIQMAVAADVMYTFRAQSAQYMSQGELSFLRFDGLHKETLYFGLAKKQCGLVPTQALLTAWHHLGNKSLIHNERTGAYAYNVVVKAKSDTARFVGMPLAQGVQVKEGEAVAQQRTFLVYPVPGLGTTIYQDSTQGVMMVTDQLRIDPSKVPGSRVVDCNAKDVS